MPVGNGDLGLNVWTEENGDLVFLIGKTDAYTENGELVKLGRVRVKLTPSPFTAADGRFLQELKLRSGEIETRGGQGGATMRVWVDANHPVAHVEVNGGAPVELQASVELWRLLPRETRQNGAELFGRGVFRELNSIPDGKVIVDPDTVLPAQANTLVWGHRNERSIYPLVFGNQHLASLLPKYPDPLLHRTSGASLSGPGLVSADDRTLRSARPATSQRLDLFALTQQANSFDDWRAALTQTAVTVPAELETARRAHAAWWRTFWDRSWINVTGSDDARKVTQGYAMQRYMDACGGRGALPIKYNGSIFTVGEEPAPGTLYDPAKGQTDADFRFWGGNSWFQNTRLLYWPMIAAGEIAELDAAQWELVRAAQRLYALAAPVIKHGTSRRYGEVGESWRYPRGWQAVVRVSDDGQRALAVFHAFEHAPEVAEVPLPPGGWRMDERFAGEGVELAEGDVVRWRPPGDFSAGVVLLSRGGSKTISRSSSCLTS